MKNNQVSDEVMIIIKKMTEDLQKLEQRVTALEIIHFGKSKKWMVLWPEPKQRSTHD